MKRRDLIRHLENNGCEFLREGGNHTIYVNRRAQKFSERTSLSRRSFGVGGCSMCGPHFCSMRITEDARKFAAEQKLSENQALEAGLKAKAKEFVEKGERSPRRPGDGALAIADFLC